ncbi:uncharacterized protein LOC123028693 [Varanus komodoensis]|uniref:uncharacterized protein LOC123028693 n=1 Tax=Varanus komodoensis TaxID=61221 RepID=UPI001CF79920|nr:uncharacterized protein LOC123028693 [Varanus komodoensis]
MSTPKAKRIKFSDEEKFLILEEFSLRKDILMPKNGRYKNTADRQQAWEEIATAVNSLNPLVQRTPEEIRRKWKNMVVDARKEQTIEKHPLLRGQPRDRLFRNIFALLNTSDGAFSQPLLYGPPRRAAPSSGSPPPTGKPLPETPCIFYLCSDSRNPQPPKTKTPQDSKASAAAAAELVLPGQALADQPAAMPRSDRDAGRAEGGTHDREEKPPIQPCKSGTLDSPRAGEERCTQSPGRASPQIQEPVGTGDCKVSQPRNCSSDLTLTCKIECPLSPLQWPYLGAAGSPMTQSSSAGSPSSDGLHSTMDDNVSMPADEDLPSGQRDASVPPRESLGEFLDKQKQLQTEVLELQKETLQLQKEKILLEKEKLLLEILKLRRELDT